MNACLCFFRFYAPKLQPAGVKLKIHDLRDLLRDLTCFLYIWPAPGYLDISKIGQRATVVISELFPILPSIQYVK